MENISIEKKALKEQQEYELKAMHESFAAKEAELKSKHSSEIQTMKQDHMNLLEAERLSFEEKFEKLQVIFITSISSFHYISIYLGKYSHNWISNTFVIPYNKEFNAELCADKDKLQNEQEEIVAKFEKVKADMCSKLEEANKEVNNI